MRNLSLRFPYLVYLSVISVLLGVLIAPVFTDATAGRLPTTSADETGMDMEAEGNHARYHGTREVPAEGAPELSLVVEKDAVDGWNVTLVTEDFTFAPTQVNGPHMPNTGHAHLYVNGVKMTRVYSPHVHVPELPPGQHVIRVSLSGNDHSYFMVDGTQIAAEVAITQEQS